ncbi:MAG: zinc ribbon domain-containing protein, partial [Candidatus Odinarchaeota archaeon]
LSSRWSKVNSILATTSQSIAAKIRDIILYYQLKFPGVPIRVHVEDLRWVKASTRQQSGYFLAHQQIRFFHSQVQHRLAHLLAEHCLPVYRVSAYRTSQKCALCGHYSKSQRQGKSFTCKNAHHLTAGGRQYAANADLNASRNIAFTLPRATLPLKRTLVFAPRYILLSINGKEQESGSLQS